MVMLGMGARFVLCPQSEPPERSMIRAITPFLLVLVACQGTTGDGIEGVEAFDLDSFEAVRNSSAVAMSVEVGNDQAVELFCDENLLGYVEVGVEQGRLILSTTDEIEPGYGCELVVSTPSLVQVDNRDAGAVEVFGNLAKIDYLRNRGAGRLMAADLDSPSMRVISEGSGRVLLSGDVGVAELDSSGEGGIQAGGLVSGDANVHNIGGGDVALTVVGQAAVTIGGDGDVFIFGTPDSLRVSDTGCGDVVLNSDEESYAMNNEGCGD